MSKYDYSDSELELMKVLKMQEMELSATSESINETSASIAKIKEDISAMACARGVDISTLHHEKIFAEKLKISANDIPSWDELVRKADESINYQPVIENFLSQNEIVFTNEEIASINEEFARRTKLNETDIVFLVIASSLQTLRWVILNKICGDIGKTINQEGCLAHDDKSIKDRINERNKKFQGKVWEKRKDKPNPHGESAKGYRSWQQILWSSVPFDTTVNAGLFGENMEGRYHRYRTFGHDPILGWIFGTANIITDTITLSNWKSYRVSRKNPLNPTKNTTPFFSERTTLPRIFYETYDSVKEDSMRLPAAVFAEFVHLESDKLTKLGLPVPLLETFDEGLAGKLYHSQYDSLCLLRDIKTVGYQAVVSLIINMLITLVHGLFYNKEKDGARDIYELRTRKILLYSNSLASVGNIAFSAATQDWKKLDVGGVIVTIARLFSDIRFITRVKKEFIEKEMDSKLFSDIKTIDEYFE